ncbi:MAG: hypothetical protein HOK49_10820 [Opitutae bacterium]|nr:hypothetical protein [Opitutae bacterium]MBT5378186.1 hypothetical protein [Opitutae bacterium]MBT5691004.1 hypothetical protein [Opitutae bacterium]MBT6463016.1 hypothetical protein [Opitutae bacterium]MBT6958103.1 hypothetical protein [Opitutae bacterium]
MFFLAAIPKLALFMIVFFVTILILCTVVLLRVVYREEALRKKMDQDSWEAKIKSTQDSQVPDDESALSS